MIFTYFNIFDDRPDLNSNTIYSKQSSFLVCYECVMTALLFVYSVKVLVFKSGIMSVYIITFSRRYGQFYCQYLDQDFVPIRVRAHNTTSKRFSITEAKANYTTTLLVY